MYFKKILFNNSFSQNLKFFTSIYFEYNCGPRIFGYYAFPTKKARLVFLFKTKKPFLENGLESPLIFVFILKGKTK